MGRLGACLGGDCGVEGGNDVFPLLHEGTADVNETTVNIVDPTADRTIDFPDASGTVSLLGPSISASEVDADVATQGELDTHTSGTAVHGAVSTLTPNTISFRDATGASYWKPPSMAIASFPTCGGDFNNAVIAATDAASVTDCTTGGGGISEDVWCVCESGTGWIAKFAAPSTTLPQAYTNTPSPPTIPLGSQGLRLENATSEARGLRVCNTGNVQCLILYCDDAGVCVRTYTQPVDEIVKLFTGKSFDILNPSNASLFKVQAAGAIDVAGTMAPTGAGTVKSNRTTCPGTDILKSDGTCMSDVVRVVEKNTTDVTIANSITETVIGLYTIPANLLGTNRCVMGELSASFLNNSGASGGATLRVRFGGTAGTLGGAPGTGGTTTPGLLATAGTSSATAKTTTVKFHVCNDGATNAQRVWAELNVNAITPGSTQSNPTGDTTGALPVEITIELSNAHASLTYTHDYAVYLLKP